MHKYTTKTLKYYVDLSQFYYLSRLCVVVYTHFYTTIFVSQQQQITFKINFKRYKFAAYIFL